VTTDDALGQRVEEVLTLDRKLISATAVIRDNAGRVLLVKHSYGRRNWELPGGSIERGEAVVDGVIREVREETGLEIAVDHLASIYDERDLDFLQLVFVGRALDADAPPRSDQHENTDCGFWPVDELPRPISDYTVRRIHDGLTGSILPLPTLLTNRGWLE
jgi:ADP-ribose pyrophosphatase YjhB (NUDIX family)